MTIGTTAMRLAVEALKQAALTVRDELKNPDVAEDVKAELSKLMYEDHENDLEVIFQEIRESMYPDPTLTTGAVDQGDCGGVTDAPDTAGNAALEPGVDESADTAAIDGAAPADATA